MTLLFSSNAWSFEPLPDFRAAADREPLGDPAEVLRMAASGSLPAGEPWRGCGGLIWKWERT
jgi:hypothetical protein